MLRNAVFDAVDNSEQMATGVDQQHAPVNQFRMPPPPQYLFHQGQHPAMPPFPVMMPNPSFIGNDLQNNHPIPPYVFPPYPHYQIPPGHLTPFPPPGLVHPALRQQNAYAVPPMPVGGAAPVPVGVQQRNDATKPKVLDIPVSVLCGKAKVEIVMRSDISFEDFREKVCSHLGRPLAGVRLGYKLYGAPKRDAPSLLVTMDDWKMAVDKVTLTIGRARSKVVGIDVIDTMAIEEKAAGSRRGRKRARSDNTGDEPPELAGTDQKLVKAYRELESELRCETHEGHCYVSPNGGKHEQLDFKEMSLWAREMALDNATVNTPPHTKAFDRFRKGKPRGREGPSSSRSTPTVPAVHVHIGRSRKRC
ncbi:hypothetical protein PAXINDRAFT_12115 [Paxillus involutus ATCC 200175]|uniref:Uncharacterized protein n=1 Tax=Paxillus involutus ATCC 200175 TaxID=664439 RepID=A0A0C9TY49_PAXIN|nr:hypothetical protein PAXINDRAFT_12115 [Paxillus involutus ATCC 200175]